MPRARATGSTLAFFSITGKPFFFRLGVHLVFSCLVNLRCRVCSGCASLFTFGGRPIYLSIFMVLVDAPGRLPLPHQHGTLLMAHRPISHGALRSHMHGSQRHEGQQRAGSHNRSPIRARGCVCVSHFTFHVFTFAARVRWKRGKKKKVGERAGSRRL